jgi:hypothetical protein
MDLQAFFGADALAIGAAGADACVAIGRAASLQAPRPGRPEAA